MCRTSPLLFLASWTFRSPEDHGPRSLIMWTVEVQVTKHWEESVPQPYGIEMSKDAKPFCAPVTELCKDLLPQDPESAMSREHIGYLANSSRDTPKVSKLSSSAEERL